MHSYAFFIQEAWRATSRLTLTPGLRYESHPQWVDRYNMLDNIFFSTSSFSVSGAPQLVLATKGSQFSRSLVNTDLTNFPPRLCVAYQVRPRTPLLPAPATSY